MAYLKIEGAAGIITRFVSMKETQERTLTVQTALDGTEYLTRFGSPVTHNELTVQVNERGKRELQSAADTLALLEVSVRQGAYTGRVSKLSNFKHLAGEWYEATATLSAQSKVSK